MNAVEALIELAHEQGGYRIGDPWRFSEFSLVAVIPIVRPVETPRAYRLLSEVQDKVKIKDTGKIDKMEITNTTDLPVLIKAGEIVAGATQERALAVSQVLMAGEEATLNCACVHSTKGIRSGQQMKSGGLAPTSVRQTLYKGFSFVDADALGRQEHVQTDTDRAFGPRYRSATFHYTSALQDNLWNSVRQSSMYMASADNRLRSFSASMGEGGGDEGVHFGGSQWRSAQEDLYGRLQEAGKKFEAILKKVPKADHQVGFALISLDGLDTLDVFGHPESWDAMCKAILKAEAASIGSTREGCELFALRPEKTRDVIIKALNESKFQEGVIVAKEHTTTHTLLAEKFMGEVVSLYDMPIHISLLRRN